MGVYNKQGTTATSIYNHTNQQVFTGYNLLGDIIFPDTVKVMTYNPQHFTGINSQENMQRTIINTYSPDIIGFQELSSNGSLPSVGASVLSDYDYIRLSNHINYMGLASKYNLENITIADYTNQDPEDINRWNETRAYMKADFLIGNTTVTWINTHLCYLTPSIKWAQMGELFNIAENYDYIIITGDFNSYGLSVSSDDYINMYKQFVDGGYNLANSTAERGFTKTWSDATNIASLNDMISNTDNIITSGNIDIINTVFDTTKFSYLNGSPIDHIPIIAELKIN